jgi:N-acetylneuraminic acid mutarotase
MPSTVTCRICRPRLEELEPRRLLAGVQPTAVEQLMLEELNDIRANPAAYGQSIGLDLSGVAPVQPLAFDLRMIAAAREHSQNMAANQYIAHITPDGISEPLGRTPSQRLVNAGFPLPWDPFALPNGSESIAGGGTIPTPASALSLLITDPGVSPPGHRIHLLALDPFFQLHQEIGIGIVQNNLASSSYYTIETSYTADTRPFLTGVVFHDDNGNGKYDPGEGFPGVAVTVSGAGTTATFDSGGYGLQVSPGTYTVTASGGGLAAPLTQAVTVGSSNVRLNFLGQPEGSWSTPAPLPATLAGAAAVRGADGRLYVLGGHDAQNRPLGTVEVYDPGSNTWSAAANLPTPRDALAAVAGPDGRIYALGGEDGTPLATVEAYNPGTNTWTTVASLPEPRAFLAAVTGTDGRIYVLGGTSSAGSFPSAVDVYTPVTNTWTTVASLPTPRTGLAAAVGGDGRIYALGGVDSSGQALATVEVYDPTAGSWTAAADMPLVRTSAAAATGADGRIYLLGGADASGTPVRSVLVYTPATAAWTTLADLPTPRFDVAAVAGSDGRIYTFGGDTSSAVVATVEALTVPVEVGFTAGAFAVAEGATSATISVLRTGNVTGIVTVDYSAVPGTARAGIDYSPVSGTLTFADGQAAQSFTVPLRDDGGTSEADETVTLLLSNPTGGAALANPPSAVLILGENNPLPVFQPGPGSGSSPGPGSSRVTDVSALVRVTPRTARFNRRTHRYERPVTLANVGGSPLAGPLSLVVTGMPRKVRLRTRTGVTQAFAPAGRSYLDVLPSGGVFLPGETLTVTLVFSGPGAASAKVRTQVLAGPGSR